MPPARQAEDGTDGGPKKESIDYRHDGHEPEVVRRSAGYRPMDGHSLREGQAKDCRDEEGGLASLSVLHAEPHAAEKSDSETEHKPECEAATKDLHSLALIGMRLRPNAQAKLRGSAAEKPDA